MARQSIKIPRISIAKAFTPVGYPPRLPAKAEHDLLSHGDWEQVMPYFFCVDHRDKPGVVAPMYLSPLQKLVSEQVDLAIRVELAKLRKIADEGGEVYIADFDRRTRGMTPEQILKTGAVNRFEVGVRLLILKSRRGGASTWSLMTAMRACLLLEGYSAVSFAEIDESMKRIFGIRRFAIERWREDIFLTRQAVDLGRASADKHVFGNGSSHLAKTAGSTTRGDKFDFIHLSEYAHYDKLDDVKQAVAVARDHAWVIKESTANGENHFYQEWKMALTPDEVDAAYAQGRYERLDRWNGYYKIFFPWWQDPGLKRPITKDQELRIFENLDEYERKLLTDIAPGCSPGHLLFRRESMRNMLNDREISLTPEQFFNQEYPATPELAFQSTGRSVFDSLPLDHQLSRPFRQVYVDLHPSRDPVLAPVATLQVYDPPEAGAAYIISADISNGIALDFCEAIIFHRHDGTRFTEVANIRSNTMSPAVFAWYLVTLAYVYNDAFIVSDSTGAGISCISNIVEKMGYDNIYTRTTTTIEDVEVKADTVRKYGFWWAPRLKETLISETRFLLDRSMTDANLVLRSRHGIEQFRIFQSVDGKKFQAPKGSYDDYVTCVLQLVGSHKSAPPVAHSVNIVKEKKGLKFAMETEPEMLPGMLWSHFIGRIDREAERNRRKGYVFGVPFDLHRG